MNYSNRENYEIPSYRNEFSKTLSSPKFKDAPIQLSCIETTSGNISFLKTNSCSKYTLIFIHGNSSSSAAFLHQLKYFGSNYDVYAFDLPGHGLSDNAKNPKATYTFSGYAGIVSEIVRRLDLKNIILIGWSLGGHIALDFAKKNVKELAGMILSGTPPISHSSVGIQAGFLTNGVSPQKNLTGYGKPFTNKQTEDFLENSDIKSGEIEIFRKAARRTHSIARSIMYESVLHGGKNDDERVHLTKLLTPLGVILNRKDKLVNLGYIQSLSYNPETFIGFSYIDEGHASFWEKPDEANNIIENYIVKFGIKN